MIPNAGFGFFRKGGLVLLAIMGLLRSAHAVDSNPASGDDGKSAATVVTGDPAPLPSYLQLQEQLRDAQLAIEKDRQEAETAATSNLLVMNERLRLMENALATERLERANSIEHSDRIILMAVGTFAGVGFLAWLLASFLQWNAVNRLAAAAASLSATHSLPVLEMGRTQPPPARALEESNARFLGLIERLEHRIGELEPPAKLPQSPPENGSTNGASTSSAPVSILGESLPPVAPAQASVINLLLNKSQTLLKLDKPEDALGCIDEVLALDPDHADALVKKGAALERLQRLDEALQCYDRAIAHDHSMTMAYLYKGSLFNRTQRYREALACYEEALKRPEKNAGSQAPPANQSRISASTEERSF
jgi:tetratricopeptide (TPR) repeat protein